MACFGGHERQANRARRQIEVRVSTVCPRLASVLQSKASSLRGPNPHTQTLTRKNERKSVQFLGRCGATSVALPLCARRRRAVRPTSACATCLRPQGLSFACLRILKQIFEFWRIPDATQNIAVGFSRDLLHVPENGVIEDGVLEDALEESRLVVHVCHVH